MKLEGEQLERLLASFTDAAEGAGLIVKADVVENNEAQVQLTSNSFKGRFTVELMRDGYEVTWWEGLSRLEYLLVDKEGEVAVVLEEWFKDASGQSSII